MSEYRKHLSQHLAKAAALLLPLLASCAAPSDWTTVGRQAFTIRAACERQHRDGLISSALGTERCANGTIMRLYADAHYPQIDVLNRYLARRETIAAAVDRKIIAAADAPRLLAEAQAEQDTALAAAGLDPIAYDTAPYKVVDLCPRPSLVAQLCN
ncbi:MAG TPA: hypothetical protein VKV32_16500 [Stellaceae bacterium]|nr:hypothetical protein [Stellaceae bacterium]